jgi:hypothetical protein
LSVIVYRYVDFRRRPVPLIPVGIRGPSQWGRMWAYADSGSAYSIFDDSVARLIGIDWRSGRPMMATTGTGATIRFFLHPVTIQMRRARLRLDVGFAAELRIGFNILGLDVFEQFNQVTFDSVNRCLTFTR